MNTSTVSTTATQTTEGVNAPELEFGYIGVTPSNTISNPFFMYDDIYVFVRVNKGVKLYKFVNKDWVDTGDTYMEKYGNNISKIKVRSNNKDAILKINFKVPHDTQIWLHMWSVCVEGSTMGKYEELYKDFNKLENEVLEYHPLRGKWQIYDGYVFNDKPNDSFYIVNDDIDYIEEVESVEKQNLLKAYEICGVTRRVSYCEGNNKYLTINTYDGHMYST